MKKIINIFLLLCPLLASGQDYHNYFEAGTKWTYDEEHSLVDFYYNYLFYSNWLVENENQELQMLESEGEVYADIKTEGEKVFFRNPEKDNSEWYLMYDFGLQPGEGCDVYEADFDMEDIDETFKCYIRCEEIIENDPEFGGLTTMVVSRDHSEKTVIYGKWIKGIGSAGGVRDNIFASGMQLLEVSRGNNIIFDVNKAPSYQTYFRAGTSWDIDYITPDRPDLYSPIKKVNLRKYSSDIRDNDLVMWIYYSLRHIDGGEVNDAKCLGYVRTEGEKVFFQYEEHHGEEWYLMYDFSLQPGEECEVCCPYFLPEEGSEYMNRFKCKEIIEKDPEFGGLTTMVMYDPSDTDEADRKYCKWLKGVGDTRGVIFNYNPALVAGVETQLLEVIARGKNIVYDKEVTSVQETLKEGSLEFRVDGGELTILSATDAPGYVYRMDGTTVATFKGAETPVRISLPGKGIYVIKSGAAFRKIYVK